jgi:transcriptional regulator with XRE-family HTH domain
MKLKAVIRRNRQSQKDVAAAIGVTEETLSRWSRGHIQPTSENLIALLAHLRTFEPTLEADDLLGEDDVDATEPEGGQTAAA